MLSIVRRARAPVLFVTHAAVVDPDGRLIHARQRLGQWAADIAARHGMALLDPTPLVEAFGIERAFDEAGRSRSHYAESFEAELADQLLARLRELAASGEAFPPAAAAIPHRSWPASPDPSTTRPASLASLRSGDLAGAAAASRLALAADPASGGALTTLAQVALRDNRSEIGLALVDLALESDPGDVGALSTRAKLLTRLKRFGEAATAWVALADRRAGAAWPFAEAARCALRAEDPGRALTLAEQGLALEPDDAVGLAIKAEALHRLGRLSELAPVGIALARQSPEAVAAVLHWLTDAGDVAGIVSVVTAVSGHLGEIAPELVRTLWTHAREADLHGRWIDLAGCLRAISLLEPNGRDAPAELQRLRRRWQVHAREALKGGRDQHAADAFDLLLAIEPEDRSATREAASLHSRLGHAQRAADLWTILCSEEADPRTLMRAARSNEVAGRDLPALALYRRALDAGSDDEKTRIYYESLTRRLSKRARMLADEAPDQATDLARKILEIVPDQAACLRILKKRISQLSADLKGAAKDGEERVRIAERLIELDPDKPDALRAIASARYSERRLPEALAHMQRLVRIQGGVAAHWIKLGRCLTKLKRYDEARSATEHALTLAPDSEAARRVMAALDSCTAA
jgi:tetratricopeptide (TPR) repeat protein